MIALNSKTRCPWSALRKVAIGLAAAYTAVASPPVQPLIIAIAPIAPRGGIHAPQDRHLSQLDNGGDDLKDALFNAWQRRTDRELDIKMPEEDVSLAVKETAGMNAPHSPAVANYVVKTTYFKVGDRTTATAGLFKTTTYTTAATVTDDQINPDAPTPFTVLGEKLADALAFVEKEKITTYKMAFCRFALNGQSQASEGLPEALREKIVQNFRRATRMPILEDVPSDCGQLAGGTGRRAAGAGGTVTIYVRGTIFFLQDQIIIKIFIAGEIVAEQPCQQEKEPPPEVIDSLIRDLWTSLNAQILRQRREG
jgi:hypothetical protein